jgi:hypothetical protein
MLASLSEIPGYVTGTWTIDPAHSDVGFAIRHRLAMLGRRLHYSDRLFYCARLRSGRKLARISSEKSCGCSQAAKWPPRSSLL